MAVQILSQELIDYINRRCCPPVEDEDCTGITFFGETIHFFDYCINFNFSIP